MLKNDRYAYRVTWSEEDDEYVGLCAESPSLSLLASTPEAVLRRFSAWWLRSSPIEKPAVNQCPNRLPSGGTAASSWSGSRQKFIANLHCKLPRVA